MGPGAAFEHRRTSSSRRRTSKGRNITSPNTRRAGRLARCCRCSTWRRPHGNWLPKAAMDKSPRSSTWRRFRVYEVATFYTMFNFGRSALVPAGLHDDAVCCAARTTLSLLAKNARSAVGEPPRTGNSLGRGRMPRRPASNAPILQVNDDFYETSTVERPNIARRAGVRPCAAVGSVQDVRARCPPRARRRGRTAGPNATNSRKLTMLADQDRIFTNLYGAIWHLRAAREGRGVGRHKELISRPRLDRRGIKASGCAARRRRVSDRTQWSFMPKTSDGRAPDRQRRREPSRHCRTATSALGPAQAVEGCLCRRRRNARERRLHLHPRRVLQRGAPLAERDRGGLRRRADRQECCGSGYDSELTCTAVPGAYICARRPLARKPRSRKGSPPQSRRSRRGRPLRLPVDRQNVETIAVAPDSSRRGAKWFAASAASAHRHQDLCIPGM